MVELVIICAGCANEYMVDTDSPQWECPSCERILENKNYPFLSARLMEAKRLDVKDSDWNALYHDIRNKALDKLMELKLQYKVEQIDLPPAEELDLGNVPEIDRLDEEAWKEATLQFIDKAHAIIIKLESKLE